MDSNYVVHSYVNIYSYDTTIYACTTDLVNDQTLTEHLSADKNNVIQWGKSIFQCL